MEKKKLVKELELSTMIQNTLKEANYKYVFDVLIDIYNEDIYGKPKVGIVVVDRILTAMRSAGWSILTDFNHQKLYAEFINKYKEDSHVFLYIESNYHDYDELVKLYSKEYGNNLTRQNIQSVIRVIDDKIKKYIIKQSVKNKCEWLNNDRFTSEEIENLKLEGIYTLEKAKELFESNRIYQLEGFGKNLIYKLATIVDEKFGTYYSINNFKMKVDILNVIQQDENTIYKLKYTQDDGKELFYIAEEYIVDGSYHYQFYQSALRIPYIRTSLLIDKIIDYKTNSIKINSKLA